MEKLAFLHSFVTRSHLGIYGVIRKGDIKSY